MEHPSQQDFDDWFAYAESVPSDIKPPDHWSIELPSDEEMLIFAMEARASAQKRIAQLYKLPASEWIHSKNEFKRAEKIVFYSKRARRSDESSKPPDLMTAAKVRVNNWRRTYTRALGSHDSSASDAGQESARREAVTKMIARSYSWANTWDYKLMQALAEYYHGDSCEKSIRAAKNLTKQLDNLLAAAEILRGTLETIAEVAQSAQSQRNSQRASRIEERAKKLVSDSEWIHAQIPIARNDPHAREKLFVQRMHRANMAASGSAKSDAILELMWLPGFKHQYERRHVERLCSELTGKKRAKKVV